MSKDQVVLFIYLFINFLCEYKEKSDNKIATSLSVFLHTTPLLNSLPTNEVDLDYNLLYLFFSPILKKINK